MNKRGLLFFACLALGYLFAPAQGLASEDGLSAALTATLQNHPAVKGQRAELESQRYAIETAKSARLPTLSGEWNKLDSSRDSALLQVRQPLWAFGKIDTPIEQAKAQMQAEQLALLQVQRQLLQETTAAYVAVQGARQRLEVANKNVGEHKKLYERIDRRRAGELASDADVLLASSRLSQAKSQRERLVSVLQVAKDELAVLTLTEIPAKEPVPPALAELPERSEYLDQALRANAEIQYKKLLIEVAGYRVKAEKIASTPTVYAEAQQGLMDLESEQTWIGVGIEGSLSGLGFGVVNRVKSAAAQEEAARHDWKSTSNTVRFQIGKLLTNLALQENLQQSQQASVDAMRDTRASFFRQYDTGLKSWLDVLNIQRELTEQLLELVQSENDQLSLKLQLAAVSGYLDAVAGIEPVAMP